MCHFLGLSCLTPTCGSCFIPLADRRLRRNSACQPEPLCPRFPLLPWELPPQPVPPGLVSGRRAPHSTMPFVLLV